MKLIFSSSLLPRNKQIIISNDRRVPMYVVCSPVADLTFGNLEEQYGEKLYEAGTTGWKNPR